MTTNNTGVPPHISAIHLNLIGSRNMLVSDFKVASTGVGGGIGFSESLKSLLEDIANLEAQISVLRQIHPELESNSDENLNSKKVEQALESAKNAKDLKIEGQDTSLYQDAKVISSFRSNKNS